MNKLLALVSTVLIGLPGGAWACVVRDRLVGPVDGEPEVKATTKVELKGELVSLWKTLPVTRCEPPPFEVSFRLKTKDRSFDLDLGGKLELLGLAAKLDGKVVIVNGVLETSVTTAPGPLVARKEVVRVMQIRAADDSRPDSRNIDEVRQAVIGKSVAEARQMVTGKGFKFRVVREDDRWLPITEDLRHYRINVSVDKGIVTSADIG